MFILCLNSSHAIGMGHLFRMMNLYQSIIANEENALFLLLGDHAPSISWLKSRHFPFEVIPEGNLDWETPLIQKYHPTVWINDRLDTDELHALKIKNHSLKLVTFDDYGSGAKYADLHVAALSQAGELKPEGAHILSGLNYLILNQEIYQYRRQRNLAERLVVSLGGSDTHGMTVRVVEYLSRIRLPATVILGPGFMHDEELEQVKSDAIMIKTAVTSLIAEFSNYDFAITGGGMTAFEAAAAGLPTLTVANECHEIGYCQCLETLGCSIYAGYLGDAEFGKLDKVMKDTQRLSISGMTKITLNGAQNICEAVFAEVN